MNEQNTLDQLYNNLGKVQFKVERLKQMLEYRKNQKEEILNNLNQTIRSAQNDTEE